MEKNVNGILRTGAEEEKELDLENHRVSNESYYIHIGLWSNVRQQKSEQK